MQNMTLVVGLFTLSVGMPLSAQKTAVDVKAAYDAHHRDFDFLLGNWEFSRVSTEFGKGHSFWAAVRLSDLMIRGYTTATRRDLRDSKVKGLLLRVTPRTKQGVGDNPDPPRW
jgi:hypothetical protein